MTFVFYHSLVSQPRELDEASRNLRLSRWQWFWRVDVPSGMIPLVWNGMMSFGGGWFFLVAAEAISVNNRRYALPGIGSYVATATADGQLDKVFIAIGVMIVMVVGVNFCFWRPLVAWAERFRVEDSKAADAPRSMVLNLLRHSRTPGPARPGLRTACRTAGSGDERASGWPNIRRMLRFPDAAPVMRCSRRW
ncbi:ABC transporter permease subunit [Nocardia sp. CA-119907]|uniref:ABC transporter permease subunit n=1 Tax=Nocardia sp. CA-119907 TaxID=3239973 RepID=UPI003D9536B4